MWILFFFLMLLSVDAKVSLLLVFTEPLPRDLHSSSSPSILQVGSQLFKENAVFRIRIHRKLDTSGQGRFQDFFQGVAKISSRDGENLPGGGEKM